MKAILASAAVGAGAFLADRLSKEIVLRYAGNGTTLIPGFLDLTKHQNSGMVGNLPVPLWLIIAFSLALMVWMAYSLFTPRGFQSPQRTMAISLILGGALGNLWDRLTQGYVFDWILLFNRSIINLADVFILAGIGWYLYALRDRKRVAGLDGTTEK